MENDENWTEKPGTQGVENDVDVTENLEQGVENYMDGSERPGT